MKRLSTLAVLCLFLAPGALLAHHSFAAQYDSSKQVTLQGTITKVEWMNPHAYFYVDVPDETGKVVNWAVEGGAPNVLYREGWKPTSLKAGDQVTHHWALARRTARIRSTPLSFKLPDGRCVFAGTSGPGGTGTPNCTVGGVDAIVAPCSWALALGALGLLAPCRLPRSRPSGRDIRRLAFRAPGRLAESDRAGAEDRRRQARPVRHLAGVARGVRPGAGGEEGRDDPVLAPRARRSSASAGRRSRRTIRARAACRRDFRCARCCARRSRSSRRRR